jgi:hypothetical protein
MAADYSQVTDSMLHQIGMSRLEFAAKEQQRDNQRRTFVAGLRDGTVCVLNASTHSTYITDEAIFGTVVPGIGDPTVRMHVANVLSTLHLADRTQAAIYALQQRLLPLSEALKDT